MTLTIRKKTNNEIHIKFYILQITYVTEYITLVTCIYSKRKYYSIDMDKKNINIFNTPLVMLSKTASNFNTGS